MSQIEVPDWVVEVAARVVAKNVGEDYDSLGPFTQDTIKATQRECITAALGAWAVPVAYQSRLFAIKTDNLVNDWRECEQSMYDAADGEPQSGATFRVEYRTLYTLRQEKPE